MTVGVARESRRLLETGEVRQALEASGRGTGWAVDALPSHHGTNCLFRVQPDRGEPRILKLYRDPVAAEIERTALLAAAHSCRPGEIPRVLDTAGLRVGDEDWPALEMSLLPGSPLEVEHGAAGHRRVAEMGELLRRVHAAPLPRAGWGSLAGPVRSATWFDHLLGRVQERGALVVELGLLPEASVRHLERQLAAAEPRFRTGVRPALVHSDLNPGNFLAGGPGRLALIDFERAIAGHWLYDLVKLSWRVFGSCSACRDAFAAGYGMDPREPALAADLELYRRVYCVDMAAYLAQHLWDAEDEALLDDLLRILRNPGPEAG